MELVVARRTPQLAGADLIGAVGTLPYMTMAATSRLNGPGGLQAVVPIEGLTDAVKAVLRRPHETPCELWLYDENDSTTRLWAGPLTGWQVREGAAIIRGQSLERYLDWMFVASDVALATTDEATILKTIIDQAQAQDYGHRALDTSTLTAVGITGSIDIGAASLTFAGRVARERSEGGYDWWIDPEARTVHAAVSRGSDLTGLTIVDEHLIRDHAWSTDVDPGSGGYASDVWARGDEVTEGVDLLAQSNNATVRATFGFAPAAEAAFGITTQADIDRLADAYLAALTVAPDQPYVTVDLDGDELDPASLHPGDTVHIRYDPGFGEIDLPTARLSEVRLQVDEDGNRTAQLRTA